jgi:hypothetical protein
MPLVSPKKMISNGFICRQSKDARAKLFPVETIRLDETPQNGRQKETDPGGSVSYSCRPSAALIT